MPRGPAVLSTVIGQLLQRNPALLHAFWLKRLQLEWPQMPEPFAQGCVPWQYDGVRLQLAVRSHVWKQELGLRRRELERAVRRMWPQLRFEKLWLRVVPDVAPAETPPPVPSTLSLRRIAPPTPDSPGARQLMRLYAELAEKQDPLSRKLAQILAHRLGMDSEK